MFFLELSCNCLSFIWTERDRTKEKRGGGSKTYITFLCFRAEDFQLLKTLTFGPDGPLCLIHRLQRPCVHMWDWTWHLLLSASNVSISVCVAFKVESYLGLCTCFAMCGCKTSHNLDQTNELIHCPAHKVYSGEPFILDIIKKTHQLIYKKG